jgi:hypothetical protein
MEDSLNYNEKSDDELKQEFEEAVEHIHPDEVPPEDPFATDGLGHEPAEEDDSGSV